jgi:Arm DNA-binding domain
MAKGLTDVAIRNLKPGPKRYEKPDPGARGLYVIVQPSGVKSFAVRYRFSGKPRKLTLKSGITLASARKEAGDALYEVEQGRDPSAAKRRRKEQEALAAANTFETVAEEYLKRECGMKRGADGRAEFKSGKLRSGPWRLAVLERLVYPTLGGKPIAEIKRSEIVWLLDKIECGELKDEDGEPIKGGPVMADRTLAVIRKILNWHATGGRLRVADRARHGARESRGARPRAHADRRRNPRGLESGGRDRGTFRGLPAIPAVDRGAAHRGRADEAG